LVEDHAVVLVPEPPRQLGKLRVHPGRFAAPLELRQLVVELVHLLDVARIELQMLGDLRVRDAVELGEMVERLLSVYLHPAADHLDPSLPLSRRSRSGLIVTRRPESGMRLGSTLGGPGRGVDTG